jgi:hypothetical protein
MTATIVRYDIIDRQTGKVVAAATTRKGATRAVDSRDNKYGAYRYTAKAVWSDEA